MKKYTGILLVVVLAACSPSQVNVNTLKGRWQITEINDDDTTLILPDTTQQYLQFLECNDAYTASCVFGYEVHYGSSIIKADTLKYTIKDDEFAVVTLNSPVLNFTKLWKSRRFYFTELSSTNLTLRRYDDSLQIKAVKL